MKPWYLMSTAIRGIPITRYVASWYIGGGKRSTKQVKEWLKSLVINGEPLTDEEIDVIADCILLGKLELEESARKFLAS